MFVCSFNPCCTGYSSRAHQKFRKPNVLKGFNPCCTGYSSRALWGFPNSGSSVVSILVVLDIAQELYILSESRLILEVSILVVLDIAQEQFFAGTFAGDLLKFQSLLYWI
ncbi:hypothetical protein THII_0564 [Thioploca ingrica]|uniref:Uncharacterized protein n=1 Tax=Thioploca ingrica TaxID=40754 RepID=A0A090BUC4_9GAMM|nr:hypothetical protein THII_0564 [Thioploca ingrica]